MGTLYTLPMTTSAALADQLGISPRTIRRLAARVGAARQGRDWLLSARHVEQIKALSAENLRKLGRETEILSCRKSQVE